MEKGEISIKQAKEVVLKSIMEQKEPKTIIESLGMKQISDEGALKDIIVNLLEQNLNIVKDYHNGKSNAFDYFVGQVMKQTRGQANPTITRDVLKEELEKR